MISKIFLRKIEDIPCPPFQPLESLLHIPHLSSGRLQACYPEIIEK